MKCRKEKDHLLDLQINGTMTIKETLQEIQYEYADCIYLAIIQWHGCYFGNSRRPTNLM
jgi:hypothetical protein